MIARVDRRTAVGALEHVRFADVAPEPGLYVGQVLVEFQPELVALTTRDHGCFARTVIPCRAEGGVSIAVPYRQVLEVLRNMDADTVEWSIKDLKVQLRAGRDRAELMGIAGESYPPRPDAPGDRAVLPASSVQTALKHVSYAMHSDDAHPVLASATLFRRAMAVEARATDCVRFATASCPAPLSTDVNQWLLCSRVVRKIIALAGAADDERLELAETQNHLHLRLASVELTAPRLCASLVHERVPTGEDLLGSARTSGASLLRAIDLVGSVDSATSKGAVLVQFAARRIRLSSFQGADGRAVGVVEATFEGDPVEVLVGLEPLRQSVAHSFADALEIFVAKDRTKVEIRSSAADNHGVVVLMTQLQS